MAKAGINIGFKPFQHRDPVSGETKTFLRPEHSRQSSPRLKNFQKCVRSQMEGKHFASGNPQENSRAIRSTFTQAAKSCAGGRAGR